MPTDIYYAVLTVCNVCTVGATLYLWAKMNYIRPFHIYFPIRVKFGTGNLSIMLLNICEFRKHRSKNYMHYSAARPCDIPRVNNAGNVRISSYWGAFVQPLLLWKSITYSECAFVA